MAEYITVVIEYEKDSDIPRFHCGMTSLGGRVTQVAFYDAMAELEKLLTEDAP